MRGLSAILIAGLTLSSAAAHAQPLSAAAAHGEANDRAADREAVKAVLARYKAAIERLDATGTEQLFAEDSRIFETGGAEGTYRNYLAHHLGPELEEFRSFNFSDYAVDVRFEGPVAVAVETYRYRIESKTGEAAERLGVATSVLRKAGDSWKIISMHNSARRPKGS